MTGPRPPDVVVGHDAKAADHPSFDVGGDQLIMLVRDVVIEWFATHARSLPWREAPTPWGVLVSEVMLAQTPVARVAPVWSAWLERWPTPQELAAEPLAEAIRAWGRLGYPRRAMRLHEAAGVITREHNGVVPADYATLRSLPGVGDYTAAAVVSFAYQGRAVVLDVNVRRLFARYFFGEPTARTHVTSADRRFADKLAPIEPAAAALWAAATMELGQVVCTARNPDCGHCPLALGCAWLAAGRPGVGERTTRRQGYFGTDRYVRGLILARLHDGPAGRAELDVLWNDAGQFARALDSLVTDGLVDPFTPGNFALPGDAPAARSAVSARFTPG